MAGWAFDWQAGPAGSLEDLSDYCVKVRMREQSVGKRGRNPVVQYRAGEYSTPRKFTRPQNLLLETVVRYTNAAGAVTHGDGAAGHFYENLGHLKRIFGGTQGALTRLQKTAPDQSDVYLDVEQLGDAMPTETSRIFSWPLQAPYPYWIGAADDANATPTWTVGGDAPVGDAVIDFTGTASGAKVTHSASGAYVQIEGALPAGGVSVDIGAGTCLRISGGADWSSNLATNKTWLMILDPGANTVAVTQDSGTPTVTADWYTQWR